MERLMEDTEKNKRLSLEIRYARDTSEAFPKTSDLFKLKKNYRNLETLVYAANLKAYLGKLVCHVNMDMADFVDAVKKVSQAQTTKLRS